MRFTYENVVHSSFAARCKKTHQNAVYSSTIRQRISKASRDFGAAAGRPIVRLKFCASFLS
jgi:hypothetical protein